jgi:hypothetical protein
MSVKITDDKWTKWDEFKFQISTSYPVIWYERLIKALRGYFIHKRSVIKTGLSPWQWWDTDSRMLYGLMSLLMQFIEEEKPFETIYWDGDEGHKHARDEMMAIKEWWQNYSKRQDEIEVVQTKWHNMVFTSGADHWIDDLNKEHTPEADAMFKLLHEIEEKLDKEEEDMMNRLVKIRHYLWT